MTEQEIQQACLDQASEQFESYAAWAATHSNQMVRLIRKSIISDYARAVDFVSGFYGVTNEVAISLYMDEIEAYIRVISWE